MELQSADCRFYFYAIMGMLIHQAIMLYYKYSGVSQNKAGHRRCRWLQERNLHDFPFYTDSADRGIPLPSNCLLGGRRGKPVIIAVGYSTR